MSHSVSDTTVSPTPFSPFSSRSYSSTSEATSDDAPDLGAFPAVFRELTAFYPPRVGRFNGHGDTTPTFPSDYDSEVVDGSTVWNQRPIASYLSSSSPDPFGSPSYTRTETDSLAPRTIDTESRYSDREEYEEQNDEYEGGRVLDHGGDDSFLDDDDQPSLALAGALDFLAAERARFVAQLDALGKGNSSTTSDGTWRHPLANRRKRRRKRNKSARPVSVSEPIEATEDNAEEPSHDDADDSSSSVDAPPSPQYYKSTPPTPPPVVAAAAEQRRQRTTTSTDIPRLTVHHSKSTPSLRLAASLPIDPRVLQLRNLAHKLRMLFPKDAMYLADILSNDHPGPSEVVDPRGPTPRLQDIPIHVFIDHSNILFGFLNYIRKHSPRQQRKRERRLSHGALALILERGRPITRRVLVTSSPLYQPIDSAEQLGYDVKVLRRVPDDGDGPDRQLVSSGSDQGVGTSTRNQNRRSYTRGHTRGASYQGTGGTSESEPNNNHSTLSTPSNGRVRYREQGVDELLQLKLHQAIANIDDVPENATIVLATGDGNVGQFNEEGFLGCVRTALKKGWKVELYSWEGSLSKAWAREFGDNRSFALHLLDKFAVDLLELT